METWSGYPGSKSLPEQDILFLNPYLNDRNVICSAIDGIRQDWQDDWVD